MKIKKIDYVIDDISIKMMQQENGRYLVSDSEIINMMDTLKDINAIDRDGRTLIIHAVFYDRDCLFDYLLKRGANLLIGDKKGIIRYGNMILPMDEALILSAVDLSGRGYLGFDVEIPTEKIGTFDSELVKEFWLAFVREARCSLHIKMLEGENSHHIVEGAFKSVARSFRTAVAVDKDFADVIPSTKGVL